MLFARPANLSAAEWSEFDLDAAEWRIAADKMKMDNAQIVPLSTQAVALLRDIHPLSGNQQYVFASNQSKNSEKHISSESIGAAYGVWATKASTPPTVSEPQPARFCMNKASIPI